MRKKKWKIYFKFSWWFIYKYIIICCVDRDVIVLLLFINFLKCNILVLRGLIVIYVDKNIKFINNKFVIMISKWKFFIVCERKNMF